MNKFWIQISPQKIYRAWFQLTNISILYIQPTDAGIYIYYVVTFQ